MKNKLVPFLFILCSLFVWVRPAQAAPVTRTGDQATVAKDEVISHDYFSAGKNVTVSGEVDGDAYLAGENIVVDGNIQGDLLVAGKSVDIRGNVWGDVRVAGETVMISGKIGGNVTLGAQTANITNTSVVGGSLLAGANELTIAAPIAKDVTTGVNKLTISDKVGGDLNYWSDNTATLAPTASVSGTVSQHAIPRDQERANRRAGTKATAGLGLGSALMLMVIGSLILYLFPLHADKVVAAIKEKPWGYLGRGLLFMILTPLVIVLLFVTILGIPIAGLMIALFALSSGLAKIYSAYFLGVSAVNIVHGTANRYITLGLGIVLSMVIMLIPLFGWLFNTGIFLMAFGALAIRHRDIYRDMRIKKLV